MVWIEFSGARHKRWRKQDPVSEYEIEAAQHSRGAVIVHRNPFRSLPTPPDAGGHDKAFIQKWVVPHYMRVDKAEHSPSIIDAANEADAAVVEQLLGRSNWRSRTVGTHLAAIKQFRALEPTIINLMLRSDLCYVGRDFALTLASFGTPAATDSLETYLEYYLRQPELWFDQAAVLAAVGWLDERNGTSRMAAWLAPWEAFTADKPNWSLPGTRQCFDSSMQLLLQRRHACLDT